MKNTRVPGHGLQREGQPYERDGVRPSSDGSGCGVCSCGARSDMLSTNAARKRWHAQHKREVTFR